MQFKNCASCYDSTIPDIVRTNKCENVCIWNKMRQNAWFRLISLSRNDGLHPNAKHDVPQANPIAQPTSRGICWFCADLGHKTRCNSWFWVVSWARNDASKPDVKPYTSHQNLQVRLTSSIILWFGTKLPPGNARIPEYANTLDLLR